MKPLKDLLVIQFSEQSKEKKSESGFLFQAPKWAKPANIAKILQKGPEVSTVDVDQLVFVNPYAAIDTEDKTIKLIREKDVLCIVEDENGVS